MCIRDRYAYEGDKIGQGRENAKTYIHENPAFFDMLEAKVRDFYFTPVSYTHLDVYKRQGCGCEGGYGYKGDSAMHHPKV